MGSVWFIDGPEKVKDFDFQEKYIPTLEKILEEPSSSILITDRPGCSNKIARYLAKKGYRNCTIYHPGESPRHRIGKFPSKGGFPDLDSCKQQLFRDADSYLCLLEPV